MLFTPKLIVADKTNESYVLNRAGMFGQPVHIIRRADCAFRRIKLKGSRRVALQAAKMRAQKESRSSDNRIRILKDKKGNGATVWSYDHLHGRGLRCLPESLCFVPLNDGSRLISCIQGVEGQVWEDNTLVASRWWPGEPSDKQWQTFLRVAPTETETKLSPKPEVVPTDYRTDLPLFSIDSDQVENVVSPTNIGALAAIIGLCCTGFMSAQYFRYSTELKAVDVQKVEISQATRTKLAKQRKIRRNIADIEKYLTLNDSPSLLSGLHSLTNVLSGEDVKIQTVRLNGEDIEFQLLGQTKLSGPDLVNAIEASPALTKVAISNAIGNKFVVKAIMLTRPIELESVAVTGSEAP